MQHALLRKETPAACRRRASACAPAAPAVETNYARCAPLFRHQSPAEGSAGHSPNAGRRRWPAGSRGVNRARRVEDADGLAGLVSRGGLS